ncbi:amidase [Emydomyces testavorans]|uniref:Amidase n=1 Tax=Emydomyces testavorans TaxID=2070801 RepID=A0AAF0DF64_9EURO|nr:amidase [Emydomyces testavorans]
MKEYQENVMPDKGPDLRMPTCRGIDMEEMSISQLQQCLTEGKFSARDLTATYLLRIERLNLVLKAIVEVNPDALEIAEVLDGEREEGKARSILHGIPFLVKDNMSTKDKMQTTAGSSGMLPTNALEIIYPLWKVSLRLHLGKWQCFSEQLYRKMHLLFRFYEKPGLFYLDTPICRNGPACGLHISLFDPIPNALAKP